MYSVRNKNGLTRWSEGIYSEHHGYYIKYESEYEKSSFYKKRFEESHLSITDFYTEWLNKNY